MWQRLSWILDIALTPTPRRFARIQLVTPGPGGGQVAVSFEEAILLVMFVSLRILWIQGVSPKIQKKMENLGTWWYLLYMDYSEDFRDHILRVAWQTMVGIKNSTKQFQCQKWQGFYLFLGGFWDVVSLVFKNLDHSHGTMRRLNLAFLWGICKGRTLTGCELAAL